MESIIFKQYAKLLVSLAVVLGVLGFIARPSSSEQALLWVLALLFVMMAVSATLIGWIKATLKDGSDGGSD